ncbi:MAG: 50S ribosomal protein L29 [Burkholderiaceae bacterium]|jgi:large subunit ribosomal protein L29
MKRSDRNKELREKDAAGLDKELGELARAHFSLRMQIATQQNTDTAQLRRLRRDMARVRTVMNQKAAQQ